MFMMNEEECPPLVSVTVGELTEKEREALEEDSQWKINQKNTFTRWANQYLEQGDPISELYSDLSDGVRLCALVEILSGKTLLNYNKRPFHRNQKLENVSICLDFMQMEEEITIVNIGSSDIVDGNSKLILGLMWALILHYSISLPEWDRVETGYILTPQQKLFRWITSRIPDKPIRNFTTDWNDGTAIGALVDAVAPGLCPDWSKWTAKNNISNATEAMNAAERWIGVSQLISPDDMCNPNVDEKSLITYLSQFINPRKKEVDSSAISASEQAIEAADECHMSGIRPNSIRTDNHDCRLTVDTECVGGETEVAAKEPHPITRHNGSEDLSQTKVDLKDSEDESVDDSLCSIASNEDAITVISNDEYIYRSPIMVNCNPATTKFDPTKVEVHGPGILKEGVTVNKWAEFVVDTRRAGHAPLKVTVTDESVFQVAVVVCDNNDGMYNCRYMPKRGEKHIVEIKYGGVVVPNSPFQVSVEDSSHEYFVNVCERVINGKVENERGRECPKQVKPKPLFEAHGSIYVGEPKKVDVSFTSASAPGSLFDSRHSPPCDGATVDVTGVTATIPIPRFIDTRVEGMANREIVIWDSHRDNVRQRLHDRGHDAFCIACNSRHDVCHRAFQLKCGRHRALPAWPFYITPSASGWANKVKTNGNSVLVKVNPTPNTNKESDGNRIGMQCDLILRIPGACGRHLEASVQGPSGLSKIQKVVEDGTQEDNYCVRFVPWEAGVYKVSVRHKGLEIKGSPFHFRVRPFEGEGRGLYDGRWANGKSEEFNPYYGRWHGIREGGECRVLKWGAQHVPGSSFLINV